jgi:hypothetical protein
MARQVPSKSLVQSTILRTRQRFAARYRPVGVSLVVREASSPQVGGEALLPAALPGGAGAADGVVEGEVCA